MAKYRVIFEDPDFPDEPAQILAPSDRYLKEAMEGNLPPIWVHWMLQDEVKEGYPNRQSEFMWHDPRLYDAQFTAPRVGPLTEEQAMEYICLKDLPRKCWSKENNRQMFKIVLAESIPTNREFRDAWEVAF